MIHPDSGHLHARQRPLACLADAGPCRALRRRRLRRSPTSSIADGKIAGIARATATPSPPTPSTSPAASCCRASSTATPISTRATSGRASPIPTAPSWARSPPAKPTARRAGAPTMSPGAWISRCARAYAHGTKALRTHLDSVPPQEEISWPVFEEMRETLARPHRAAGRLPARHRGRARRRPGSPALAKRVAAAKGVLGAVTYMVPDLEELLDRDLRAGDRARPRPRFPCRRDRRHLGHLAEEDRRSRHCGTVSRARSWSAIAARWRGSPTATCSTRWTRSPRPASPSCRCRCAISICRTAGMTAPRRAGAA